MSDIGEPIEFLNSEVTSVVPSNVTSKVLKEVDNFSYKRKVRKTCTQLGLFLRNGLLFKKKKIALKDSVVFNVR